MASVQEGPVALRSYENVFGRSPAVTDGVPDITKTAGVVTTEEFIVIVVPPALTTTENATPEFT